MTAVGKFLADPFGFLKSNMILVPFTDIAADRMDDAPIELTFYSVPTAMAVASQLGTPLGLYFLTRPDAIYNPQAIKDGRTFKAYFCPYAENDTLGTVIGSKADYMFTTAMDGCTMGIGSANSEGGRLIFHSNLAKLGEGGQASGQATTLKLTMGASLEAMFEPKDYRYEYGVSSLLSTTFGVRAGKSWSFYAQTYTLGPSAKDLPRKYFRREIKQIL
jgi:hypothetical protein